MGLLDIILNWGMELKAVVDAAKHNKSACQGVLERVQLLESVTQRVRATPVADLKQPLERVKTVLWEALEFVRKYSTMKRISRFVFSTSFRDEFSEVGRALDTALTGSYVSWKV